MNMPTESRPSASLPPPVPPLATPVHVENRIAALLKAPAQIGVTLAAGEGLVGGGIYFLVCALILHAVFGFAIGLFGGWSVGGMAAVKAPLIAACSLVLCLPSLYVFSAVGGAPLSLRQTFMLGTSCLAMVGLLLIGLAPVAWLFAVSTENLPFVVMLVFVLWVISLSFAARYIGKLRVVPLLQRTGGIGAWFMVLALVSLQMTTCMRPLLVKPDPVKGWWTGEKSFFLAHFGSTFDDEKKPAAPAPVPVRK